MPRRPRPPPLLGNLLAASATLRHAVGDPSRAADDLIRAVPMLDQHRRRAARRPGPIRPVPARLLDLGRPFEGRRGGRGGIGRRERPAAQSRHHQPAVPSCTWPAARPSRRPRRTPRSAPTGPPQRGAGPRQAPTGTGRMTNLIAQAEAWQLAAPLGWAARPGPPPTSHGRPSWPRPEATGFRAATLPTRTSHRASGRPRGLDAAASRRAPPTPRAVLAARIESPAGRARPPPRSSGSPFGQLRWHRLAVAEGAGPATRPSLVGSGEAMAQVNGLEDEYQELGRRLVGPRPSRVCAGSCGPNSTTSTGAPR